MKYCNVLMLCLIYTSILSQSNTGFTITGKIKNVPNGTYFYLVKNGGKDTVSSTKIFKGKFEFSGRLTQEGELHFVKLDTNGIKLDKGKKSYVRLLLDHSSIKLTGDVKDWPIININGSVATVQFEDLYKKVEDIRKQSEQRYAAIASAAEPYKTSKGKAETESYFKELFHLFEQHSNSYAAPFVAFNYSPDSISFLSAAYDLFTPKIQQGYYAQAILKERIPFIEMRSQLISGKKMPDFWVQA